MTLSRINEFGETFGRIVPKNVVIKVLRFGGKVEVRKRLGKEFFGVRGSERRKALYYARMEASKRNSKIKNVFKVGSGLFLVNLK